MSIDGIIVGFTRRTDAETTITLEPRLGDRSAGQSVMAILNPPPLDCSLADLIDCEVWGPSSCLMLGDKRLADRQGYIAITLVDGWDKIVTEWKSKRATK